MALSLRLQYHVVVLCRSRRDADDIDLLGDRCGQELYFHGEPCPSDEDVSALMKVAKLIILPGGSVRPSSEADNNSDIVSPTLLVERDKTLYYPNGQRSAENLETTLMECLMALPEAPMGAAICVDSSKV
jgi:hypothetical protein